MNRLRTWVSLGVAALLLAPSAAQAGNAVQVPEIGPGSISAGLAVLAGGVLLLRARRSR